MKMNWKSLTYETLSSLVEQSKSRKHLLELLELRAAGSNFNTLAKYLKKFGLSDKMTERVKISGVLHSGRSDLWSKERFDKALLNNTSIKRSTLKRLLIKYGYKENKCEVCGVCEWQGRVLSLQLHHIDGVYNNNVISNLQILCPNCHSQTSSFAGKSIKRSKDKIINKVHKPRPTLFPKDLTLDVLMNDITTLGYSATGRKYKVSDNAIRIWIKRLSFTN